MDFKPYNKKAFLLPDSINSAAMYHAKLFPDGKYVFRIHDCLGGIRLTGELKEEQDYIDAVDKLSALCEAAKEFAFHIYELRIDRFKILECDCQAPEKGYKSNTCPTHN